MNLPPSSYFAISAGRSRRTSDTCPTAFHSPTAGRLFPSGTPVGVGMNRHLIESVGTAALQGHQLLDRGKVYMENVAVERQLPHIGPGVGGTGHGHPRMDGGQQPFSCPS